MNQHYASLEVMGKAGGGGNHLAKEASWSTTRNQANQPLSPWSQPARQPQNRKRTWLLVRGKHFLPLILLISVGALFTLLPCCRCAALLCRRSGATACGPDSTGLPPGAGWLALQPPLQPPVVLAASAGIDGASWDVLHVLVLQVQLCSADSRRGIGGWELTSVSALERGGQQSDAGRQEQSSKEK